VHEQRRRLKQLESLEERLAEDANRLREEAKLLPPGAMPRSGSPASRNRLTHDRVADLAPTSAAKARLEDKGGPFPSCMLGSARHGPLFLRHARWGRTPRR
jgi:hypothetical protein